MPGRLDADQITRFRADGFLPFTFDLSESELSAIRSTLVNLHHSRTGFKEGAAFDAIGPDDGSGPERFPQILHPRNFAPTLMETEYFRRAAAVAEQILGPHMRFKADISLMKPAEIGCATPWHQDEAFHDPRYEYNELSFWLALQPVDERNSCMMYLPGSHLGPVKEHGFPGGDARVHALECVADFDKDAAVVCALPAGGCVIHSQRTLHAAPANVSDGDRLAYVLIFDTVPTLAHAKRDFPWLRERRTARDERERNWRRNGGLLVHLWRQRRRMRVVSARTLLFDLRRAGRAVARLVSAG
jgi:hypothetical protein